MGDEFLKKDIGRRLKNIPALILASGGRIFKGWLLKGQHFFDDGCIRRQRDAAPINNEKGTQLFVEKSLGNRFPEIQDGGFNLRGPDSGEGFAGFDAFLGQSLNASFSHNEENGLFCLFRNQLFGFSDQLVIVSTVQSGIGSQKNNPRLFFLTLLKERMRGCLIFLADAVE